MTDSSKPWAANIRTNIPRPKLPSVLPQLYRIFILIFLFLALAGYAVQQEGKLPFHLPRNRSFPTSTSSPIPQIRSDELLQRLNDERNAQNLSSLKPNASLEKAARLLSLDIEDSQVLKIPEDVSPYLSSVSTALPTQIETFSVFFSGLADLSQFEPVASSSAIQAATFTEVGIATREATIQNVEGVLAVVMVSPAFSNSYDDAGQEALPQTVSRQPPTYTGEDLWQAVQNYRRAQQLPEFNQANELCTVASIRLNELLELGKLDNHDGFDARADQFFERNTSWTAINENLAAGYDTAVQAVEWGWDQSLGHKALIRSREFPYACTAASRGFSVLITGKK